MDLAATGRFVQLTMVVSSVFKRSVIKGGSSSGMCLQGGVQAEQGQGVLRTRRRQRLASSSGVCREKCKKKKKKRVKRAINFGLKSLQKTEAHLGMLPASPAADISHTLNFHCPAGENLLTSVVKLHL